MRWVLTGLGRGVSSANSAFRSLVEIFAHQVNSGSHYRLTDQTHLTNFSRDKTAWLVYMTISNILSRTRNSPAKMQILLLALLPVPPKFTGESARANEAQRQTNVDTLRAVFDLVLAPLQLVAQEGTVMDCADGKTRLCFPILSAWIVDHAEHAALQGIGSMSCPKCQVPCEELGGDLWGIYETRHYMRYREKALRYELAQAACIAEYFQRLGVKIGNNVFIGLDGVSPADLYKPDLFHNIYLGLSKHIME